MNKVASLEQILANKEQRVKRQKQFIRFAPLLCVSVNMPGGIKLSKDCIYIYDQIINELEKHVSLKQLFLQENITGKEGIYSSSLDAISLKKLSCDIENNHFLGRFIDLDVIDKDLKILSRTEFNMKQRTCLLCKKEAVLCARSQAHKICDLLKFISEKVSIHKKVKKLSFLATKSMKKEVYLTPKAGLVDRFDNGSHEDMDLNLFLVSIKAIEPFLQEFIWCGYFSKKEEIFLNLRKIGLKCEKSMFKATRGVNTHKGLIFSFALILGACGYLLKTKGKISKKNLQKTIKYVCANLMKEDFKHLKKPKSAGERYFLKTKNGGIRQEAMSGYESIFGISLPFLNIANKKYKKNKALKLLLLKLICTIHDTSLYNRGGTKGLKYAKKKAQKILDNPKHLNKKIYILNQQFRKKNLSSGGSADMLALSYFIHEAKFV